MAFSSHAMIFWDGSTSHSPSALFFFFLGGGIGLSRDQFVRTSSTLLGKDQSTVAQRAETTVDKRSLTSIDCGLISRLISRFPHYAWTALSAHSCIGA